MEGPLASVKTKYPRRVIHASTGRPLHHTTPIRTAADANKSFRFWVFACLIQIATNLHNDYADFIKGADDENRIGQARATQKGWLTPRQTAGLATLSLGLAHGIGVQLAREAGSWMWFVTWTSVFNAVAYTGGPYPLGYVGLGWVSLGYTGLGDVFVFAYFGIVATVAPLLVGWHGRSLTTDGGFFQGSWRRPLLLQ